MLCAVLNKLHNIQWNKHDSMFFPFTHCESSLSLASWVELSWVSLSRIELSRVLADRLFVSELDKLMWVTVEHSVSVFNAQTQTGIHLRCYSTANISTKVVWNWDKFNQQQAKPKSSFHSFIWIIEQSFLLLRNELVSLSINWLSVCLNIITFFTIVFVRHYCF